MNRTDFIELIDQNKGTIRSLCNYYFTDSEDRKDAFQDIVLQLWNSVESFRGDSNVNTWIYSVSLNTIFYKIRKSKKSVNAENLLNVHLDIAGKALVDDDKELLSLLMQSLKELDKAIVILHLEGYQNKEIAEILGITPSNVSTKFNRIKNQLRTKFNKTIDANR